MAASPCWGEGRGDGARIDVNKSQESGHKQDRRKAMGLKEYQEKRHFEETAEPKGKVRSSPSGRMFVIQKHAARRLHYDLRLEMDGVLKSWAVPKGPSYNPGDKRLAVQVEDHPIEYGDFEGTIEPGQYGAGTVMVWDRGTWMPLGDWRKEFDAGKLKFRLDGEKLKGVWTLVRMKKKEDPDSKDWLLIKDIDEKFAPSYRDVTAEEAESVKTGRSLDEIKTLSPDKWISDRPAKKARRREKPPLPELPAGAKKAAWPDSFFPQLATLVSEPPQGEQWLNEIKFDGYRLLAFIRKGDVRLMTRRGQNWTEKFDPIAKELTRFPIQNGILDGEVVVQNPDGTTNFQKLQNYLKHKKETPLLFYVFDLPYFLDHDLTGTRLVERKNVLRELIRTHQARIPSVQYSDHVAGSGTSVFKAACEAGAEGIISKRADSLYVQKRSKSWVKVKCKKRQEFVIGGYTTPLGSRTHFGSLLLGYYDEAGRLVYSGNVGTGFNEESITNIYERLVKLERDHSPFDTPVRHPLKKREIHWTSPLLVADVEFTDWTDEGILRHPSFMGLREDKRPREVKLEREAPPPEEGASLEDLRSSKTLLPIRLTHPDKVLYPDMGLTKKDLADYYSRISRWVLPELVNRPLSLVRCPEGAEQECFFHKHLGEDAPEWLKAIPVQEKGKKAIYSYVEDLNGLLSLVQMGVLEIHPWGSRISDLEHPDRIIFDLDPAPEISKERLIEATHFVRDWLLKNKLRVFLKTTGGKGIHVVIPMNPSMDWDEVRKVTEVIAKEIVRQKPDWFIATMTKRRRTDKIFLDYFRNNRGATAILPYSTRARPGAPVALPVSPEELTVEFLSHPLNVPETIDRLKKLKKDPWEEINE